MRPWSLLPILLLLAGAAIAREPARYVAADPGAPPVTLENLMESERFWPYQVQLVEDWTPPGAQEPLPRYLGVLVRVESPTTVRMDFGGRGRHELPVSATDLVARANGVRLGEVGKMAPNLVLAIGNKMLDPRPEQVAPFRIEPDTDLEALLCLFADPMAGDFPSLVEPLRPLLGRERLQLVLLPQGGARDTTVWRRLRKIGFPIPFALDRFSAAYRRSLAGEDAALPHAMLLTPDGRVLHRSAWDGGLGERVIEALPGKTAGTGVVRAD